METMGMDPSDPEHVAKAKFQVVFETKVGGAPTIRDGFERAMAAIRARDPGLLEVWHFTLGVGRNIKVSRRSAVDRLADVAETD
jgi:hypothetical protein